MLGLLQAMSPGLAILLSALVGSSSGQCGDGSPPVAGPCRHSEPDDLGMLQLARPVEEETAIPAACKKGLPESPALAPFEAVDVLTANEKVTLVGGSEVTLWGEMPNSGCSPQGPEQVLTCNHTVQESLGAPEQLLTWIEAGSEGGTHYFALKATNGFYCGASAEDSLVRCDREVVGRCEKFEMSMERYPILDGLKNPCKEESCRLAYDRLVRCERSKGDAGSFYLSCESCRSQCTDGAFSTKDSQGSESRKHRGWKQWLAHQCSTKKESWTCETYSKHGWCFGGAVAPCGRVFAGVEHGSPEMHCCACGGGSENSSSVKPFRPPTSTPRPTHREPWEGSKTCPTEVGASLALRGPEGMAESGNLTFMAGSKVALWGSASLPKPGCAVQDENQGEVRCDHAVLSALETHKQVFTFVEAGSQMYNDSSGAYEKRFFALQASTGMYCGVDADPDAGLPGGVLRCNKKTVGPCEKFSLQMYTAFASLAEIVSQCDSGDFRPGRCGVLFSRQVACDGYGTGSAFFMTCESQCRTECEDSSLEGEEWANGDDCRAQGFTASEGCSQRGWTCEAYRQKGWCYGGSVAPCFEEMAGEAHGRPEQNCCICGGGGEGFGLPNPQPFRPPGALPLEPVKPEKCGEDGKTCPTKVDPSPPMTPSSTKLESGDLKMIGGSVIAMWVQSSTSAGTRIHACSLAEKDDLVNCANLTTASDLEQQRFTLVDAGVYGDRRWFALQGSNGMYCGVGDPAYTELPGILRCNKKTIGNCEMFDLQLHYPIMQLDSVCNSPDFWPGNCGMKYGSSFACVPGAESNLLVSCEQDCGTECMDFSEEPGNWTSGDDCMSEGFGDEDGCTEDGWICEGYRKQGWCLGGSVSPCFADKAGVDHKSPEVHCCICGGGEKMGDQVAPFRFHR